MMDGDFARGSLSRSLGLHTAALRRARLRNLYARGGKRCLDVAAALLFLFAFAPVLLALAALVARDGGRPFFGHLRVGRDGRIFRCWKLRTMVQDAEARLQRVLETDPEAAAEWARNQKLSVDPRVTRFGTFLRRSSLDELPQFWNVLVGDMSLVGPRPVTEGELGRYGEAAGDYLSARPGITGLWQVMGRNTLSYADRVRLDQQYVRGIRLGRDLRILFATARVVLLGTGG